MEKFKEKCSVACMTVFFFVCLMWIWLTVGLDILEDDDYDVPV